MPAPTVLATSLAALFDGATAPAPPMEPIADDSGRLQMLVPADWGDRRTTPSVAASTDLAAFLDGYDAPGTTAVVVDESPVEALRAYDFGEDCEPAGEGGYEIERLEGEYRAWRRCGGTGTSIVAVAAETDGGDTVVVLAQLLGPADLAALDVTLASSSVMNRVEFVTRHEPCLRVLTTRVVGTGESSPAPISWNASMRKLVRASAVSSSPTVRWPSP